MYETKNIVIVGAGYSGVLTAKRLAKKLKQKHQSDTVTITVIDKNPYHTMLTELHEVAAGRVGEESIKMSLERIFAGRKVDIVTDKVLSVDFAAKNVACENGAYNYDYLVLAAGSRPTGFGVPGMKENALTLWSYDDAVKLHEKIRCCFRSAALETSLEKRRKLLTFSVVGAGFTGVEMAGELAEYVPELCDVFEIPQSEVKIDIIDVLPRTVPNLPEKLSVKIENRLRKMGVNIKLDTKVIEIGEGFIITEKDGVKERSESETIIWVAGVESAQITTDAAKELKTEGRGRIVTDQYLRSVDDENVFIVGDNMFFIPEGEKSPVPQMVENCEQSAHTAADNIIAAIENKPMKAYKPAFHGVMVCVGGRYGVAHVGGKNKFILPSFFAMFVKHFINIVYFCQVLGWNKVASYMKHEFFTIRNKRSFVGGHFSNRTPSFLLVLLRAWLGGVWVFEGVMKIAGGWFGSPMLKNFFGYAADWFNQIISGVPSDATSSATNAAGGVGEAVGKVLVNFNFLGIFKFLFVSGTALSDASLDSLAVKLDIPLLNWFLEKVVLSGDTMQVVMQITIVALEIAIGLALISGLFTTPAAAASIVLMFMFASTTGLYLTQFWMIFAAVALLFSGRVFGLDYYTTPALKKGWKKIGWVKRSYLYND